MTGLDKIYRRLELYPEYLKYRVDFLIYYYSHPELHHSLACPVSFSFGIWLYREYYNEELWYQDKPWSPIV